MARSSASPVGAERVLVAEDVLPGWPWRFEAWPRIDREGRPGLSYSVYSPADRAAVGGRPRVWIEFPRFAAFADLDREGLDADFMGPADYAVSVLAGVVSSKVEAVVVTTAGQDPRHGTIVTVDGLAQFFFVAFERFVERAEVSLEPRTAGRTRSPRRMTNVSAQRRRMQTECVLAEGLTPEGDRWRFEADDSSYHFAYTHDLATRSGGSIPATYGGSGSRYRPPRRKTVVELLGSADNPVQLDLQGGYAYRNYAYGHVARGVHAVHVLLDDGVTVAAEIHPIETRTYDLFVAFLPRDYVILGVQALDTDGNVTAEQMVDPGTVEWHRDERANPTL